MCFLSLLSLSQLCSTRVEPFVLDGVKMLFCCVAKVAELEQRNVFVEDELRARVNYIHTVQNLLNASRHEYSKLENQLKAIQHDLAQQRVGDEWSAVNISAIDVNIVRRNSFLSRNRLTSVYQ